MEKRIAAVFYVALGIITIGFTWLFDANQNQPAVATEVKSPVINLNASDFDESKNLKDAVDRLSKSVEKPTTNGSIDQLQPALKNQDSAKLPQ